MIRKSDPMDYSILLASGAIQTLQEPDLQPALLTYQPVHPGHNY